MSRAAKIWRFKIWRFFLLCQLPLLHLPDLTHTLKSLECMRIKEMITNLRSIDLQMNSLFQYQKKHTKNSMENMDTDVRVSRVKHLHIQWYNTCTLLEIGCLGEVETFNWLLHNIMERWWWWWYLWCKLTKWMLYDDQIKSLLIITLCTCFEIWEKKITNMS